MINVCGIFDKLLAIKGVFLNANISLCQLYVHHNEHFSVGFILLLTGQLNALENSSEFDKVPSTLKVVM